MAKDPTFLPVSLQPSQQNSQPSPSPINRLSSPNMNNSNIGNSNVVSNTNGNNNAK
jgi:hypothetical protein